MDLSPMDEYFAHQLVEPAAHMSQNDPSWAERLFVGLHDPGNFILHTGISLYPNNDTVESYATFKDWNDLDSQHSIRQSTDLADGRSPVGAGSVRLQTIEPMKHFRISSSANDLGLEYDLDIVTRGAAHGCESVKRWRKGRLAYDNIVAFQPFRANGQISFRGKEFDVVDVLGHRDRSWGIRTSGEGRIPRGLYLWVGAEFEDVSILVFLQERHTGEIVRHSGAVTYASDGRSVPFVTIAHDLDIDGDARELRGAKLTMTDAEGKTWSMEATPESTLFMAGAGYTSWPDRRGKLGVPSWHATWDLTDKALVKEIDGLNDYICAATLNGSTNGRCVVETLYGEYEPYGLHAADGATFDEV